MGAVVGLELVDAQEALFARAFGAGDVTLARELYHPEVVYVSPTTRLFGREGPITGLEPTLEFVQLTISGCRNIGYHLDERALIEPGDAAYTRIVFDWDSGDSRWRSVYVVIYRYREGRIGRQELYYDPSARLERLAAHRT